MRLNELRDACHANACAKGFHDPEVTPSVGESIALMHSELSEALEDHRKGMQPGELSYEFSPDKPPKPCGIPSEMADVIIRVLDFCGKHKIDIEMVVHDKMAYNAKRPHRHGGKKL